MPDISMCKGDGCADKAQCYRHKARPDRFHQSWFHEPPGTSVEDCKFFMAIWDDNKPKPKGTKLWPKD